MRPPSRTADMTRYRLLLSKFSLFEDRLQSRLAAAAAAVASIII